MNAPFSLGRGFAHPVFGPQAVFRGVLDALSHPGRVVNIPAGGVEGPASLPTAALAIVLTLCDYETPVWIDEGLHAGGLKNWLAFHCGAPVTREPEAAGFALLAKTGTRPPLSRFAQGDDRYPDRSATLIVLCDSLQGGAPWILSGPGIRGQEMMAPQGVCQDLLNEARGNHAQFPRGVDLLFVSTDALIGLPRSTQLSALEGN